MTTLTVNIDDQTSVKAVEAFLESMGLIYSIDADASTPTWWEDKALVEKLDIRSEELKNGKDKGSSFAEIKEKISRR